MVALTGSYAAGRLRSASRPATPAAFMTHPRGRSGSATYGTRTAVGQQRNPVGADDVVVSREEQDFAGGLACREVPSV
jgi:hypothetical protein